MLPRLVPLFGLMCPHSAASGSFADNCAFACVYFVLACIIGCAKATGRYKSLLTIPSRLPSKGNGYPRNCVLECNSPLLCFLRHAFCTQCESVALEMTTNYRQFFTVTRILLCVSGDSHSSLLRVMRDTMLVSPYLLFKNKKRVRNVQIHVLSVEL